MGLFKRRLPWTPNDIPDLSFEGATDSVDIGFLGGDEHREAFKSIFVKMLNDNREVLSRLNLVGIDAKRPFTLDRDLPVPLDEIDPFSFALVLYDSSNERIFLRLSGQAGEKRLGVIFDNPTFWLE